MNLSFQNTSRIIVVDFSIAKSLSCDFSTDTNTLDMKSIFTSIVTQAPVLLTCGSQTFDRPALRRLALHHTSLISSG